MNKMNKACIPALMALVLLASLHLNATVGQWYVRYRGFDIIMHILGGIGLALSIYWILVTFLPNYALSFWRIILLTFLAGVAWEVFEAVNDIAGAPVGTTAYYLDTLKDLFDDALGAVIATYFSKK